MVDGRDSDASLPPSVDDTEEPSLPDSIPAGGASDPELAPAVEEGLEKKFDIAKQQTHFANFSTKELVDCRQMLFQEVRRSLWKERGRHICHTPRRRRRGTF